MRTSDASERKIQIISYAERAAALLLIAALLLAVSIFTRHESTRTGKASFLIGTVALAVLVFSRARARRLERRLAEIIKEYNEAAKILIRRDLELSEANARLQELDSIKSEFVSIAAHQLRTPLTGIRWSYLAMLEETDGALAPKQREVAEDGLHTTMRAIELINDLLDVARIEEGRFGFTMTRQSVVPIAERIYANFLKTTEDKGIRLLLEANGPATPPCLIDAEKISVLLDNIVDNAVKYTPPGGTILLRVSHEGAFIRISVKDTGIGIPTEQQKRVFTKFFRGDNAQLFQTSGTGLGLYVAKNIAERHNGTLVFESAKGQGTTFTLTLPIADGRAKEQSNV